MSDADSLRGRGAFYLQHLAAWSTGEEADSLSEQSRDSSPSVYSDPRGTFFLLLQAAKRKSIVLCNGRLGSGSVQCSREPL